MLLAWLLAWLLGCEFHCFFDFAEFSNAFRGFISRNHCEQGFKTRSTIFVLNEACAFERFGWPMHSTTCDTNRYASSIHVSQYETCDDLF